MNGSQRQLDPFLRKWLSDMEAELPLVAQMVKNPPACETQDQSLGLEDPLEKGIATYSSILV